MPPPRNSQKPKRKGTTARAIMSTPSSTPRALANPVISAAEPTPAVALEAPSNPCPETTMPDLILNLVHFAYQRGKRDYERELVLEKEEEVFKRGYDRGYDDAYDKAFAAGRKRGSEDAQERYHEGIDKGVALGEFEEQERWIADGHGPEHCISMQEYWRQMFRTAVPIQDAEVQTDLPPAELSRNSNERGIQTAPDISDLGTQTAFEMIDSASQTIPILADVGTQSNFVTAEHGTQTVSEISATTTSNGLHINSDYKRGLREGKSIGRKKGYDEGYDEGLTKGSKIDTWDVAYQAGYQECISQEWDEIWEKAKQEGVEIGWGKGRKVGRNDVRSGRVPIHQGIQTEDFSHGTPTQMFESTTIMTTTTAKLPPETTKPDTVVSPPALPPPKQFNWADDADQLPIAPGITNTTLTPRDLSILRSDRSRLGPFHTLQKRVRRRQNATRTGWSRQPRIWPPPTVQQPKLATQVPPPAAPERATLMPTQKPPTPAPLTPSLKLDWDSDPRLSALSHALRDLGWVLAH